MASSYKEIRNERQREAMSGLSQQEFTSLGTAFGIAYEQVNGIAFQHSALRRRSFGSLADFRQ